MVITRLRVKDPTLWGTAREYQIRIDRADPTILIYPDLLVQIMSGGHHPDVKITRDLLTIMAVNGTVRYRIGSYDHDQRAFLCSRTDEPGRFPMSEQPQATIGRIVHYTLTKANATHINKCRDGSAGHPGATGGNLARAGEVFPMTITKIFDTSGAVNGQVRLDGNDTFWATSVCEGDGEGHWVWPLRV